MPTCYHLVGPAYRPVDFSEAQISSLHNLVARTPALANATHLETFFASNWDLQAELDKQPNPAAWSAFTEALRASITVAHAAPLLAFVFLKSIQRVQSAPDIFQVSFWKVYDANVRKVKYPESTAPQATPADMDLRVYETSFRQAFASPGITLSRTLGPETTPSPTPSPTPTLPPLTTPSKGSAGPPTGLTAALCLAFLAVMYQGGRIKV